MGGFFVVRFRVVRVEGLPHPTNLPPEGNPPLPHPTQVGSFLFFGDFSAFLNLSASRKSDFLFPANIFGGNPARSWPRISPAGHGIAAGSRQSSAKHPLFVACFIQNAQFLTDPCQESGLSMRNFHVYMRKCNVLSYVGNASKLPYCI